jgi:putative ABC transport system permease protein
VGSLDTTLSRWLAGEPWDLAVDFLHPVSLDRLNEMRALPSVVRAEPYFACWVEMHARGRVADSSFLGLVPGSELSSPRLAEGRPFGPGREREAVITRDLGQRLGVGVGDVVEVQATTERYPVRVVGLNWAAIGGLSMVSLPVAQEVCQFPDRASGAYVETAGDPPLGQLGFVGKVLAKRDVAAQVKQLLSLMITVLDLATVISILVSMLVILTSISLSVLDNDREFATLQALGYSRRLVSTIVLGEVAVYAVGAAALSIPIAIATTLYLDDRLSLALIEVDSRLSPAAFATVLVPGVLGVPLGAVPALRHVLRRDFLTRLRERTLE